MSVLAYGVAGWLMLIGCFGMAASRDLVHTVVSFTVTQAGTYVLLLAVGFQRGATPPVFASKPTSPPQVVDPVVQALTLTDIVVSATVTALLLAFTVQIRKRHGTTDPDQLSALQG
jgi:multicomponent Na+:H+ antiporter subunit C